MIFLFKSILCSIDTGDILRFPAQHFLALMPKSCNLDQTFHVSDCCNTDVATPKKIMQQLFKVLKWGDNEIIWNKWKLIIIYKTVSWMTEHQFQIGTTENLLTCITVSSAQAHTCHQKAWSAMQCRHYAEIFSVLINDRVAEIFSMRWNPVTLNTPQFDSCHVFKAQ